MPFPVPLGSIPELPAKSCQEIKDNEEGQAVSGKYWFYSIIPGTSVFAYCNMTTNGMLAFFLEDKWVNLRLCDECANVANGAVRGDPWGVERGMGNVEQGAWNEDQLKRDKNGIDLAMRFMNPYFEETSVPYT